MSQLEGVTILLVEDDTPDRILYSSWLEEAGATCKHAINGRAAVNKWNGTIDVVLMKRRLPNMFSDEIVTRANEQGLDTPIVLLTDIEPNFNPEDRGINEVLTKPTDEDELITAVQSVALDNKIRPLVRDFIRTGAAIQRLQSQHSSQALETHGEYHQLRQQYQELAEEVKDISGKLTTEEKQLLMGARNRLN